MQICLFPFEWNLPCLILQHARWFTHDRAFFREGPYGTDDRCTPYISHSFALGLDTSMLHGLVVSNALNFAKPTSSRMWDLKLVSSVTAASVSRKMEIEKLVLSCNPRRKVVGVHFGVLFEPSTTPYMTRVIVLFSCCPTSYGYPKYSADESDLTRSWSRCRHISWQTY